MGAARTAVLRIVTRCRTVDELVVALEPYTDDESILFGSDKPRSIGSRRRFVLELVDGTSDDTSPQTARRPPGSRRRPSRRSSGGSARR